MMVNPPSKQNKTKDLLNILAISCITAAVVIFVPLSVVLAINQFLPESSQISYNFSTWAASVWLAMIIGGIRIINNNDSNK